MCSPVPPASCLAALCPGLCLICSQITGRIQDYAVGLVCHGGGTRGWRVRTIRHLPGQLPLASPREGQPSISVSSRCSGQTPAPGRKMRLQRQSQAASFRGNVCPRNTTPRSQVPRPFSGQALAAFRVKTLAPFCWWNCSYFSPSLETLPLSPEPRETTKEHVLLCIVILQIRKLKIMPRGRQNGSKIKTPFRTQSKGSVEVTGLTASYLSFRYSLLCHELIPASPFTAQADCRLPSPRSRPEGRACHSFNSTSFY